MSPHTVRSFQSQKRARLKATSVSVGTRLSIGSLVLLPEGVNPRNHRNTTELEVGKRTVFYSCTPRTNRQGLPGCSAAFIPYLQVEGLTPQLVSWQLHFAKARISRLTSARYHMCVCGVNAQSDSSFQGGFQLSGACSHGKPRLPNCAAPGMLVARSPLVRS